MMLNTIVHGAPDGGPPLIIAHGLFGSARNWGVIAKRLSDTRQVIAVDMRNHGMSPHDPAHTYPAMADDLAGVIESVGGIADVLGHSMGGKAVMYLALRHPGRVNRLIVADIAPVAYTHTQLDNIRAMQAVDLARVTRRRDADDMLAKHITDPSLRAFFLQSLDLGGDIPRWRLNLDALADQMPFIMGWPGAKTICEGPTLFVAGGRSNYVTDANFEPALKLFPQAVRETIPEADHWLHADAPRAFCEIVSTFLSTNAGTVRG